MHFDLIFFFRKLSTVKNAINIKNHILKYLSQILIYVARVWTLEKDMCKKSIHQSMDT